MLFLSLGTQAACIKVVKSLITTMKEMGNPFWETSGDVLILDTRVVAEVADVDSIIWRRPTQGVLQEKSGWPLKTQSTK